MTTKEVTVSVHRTTPACCRSALISFAALDPYAGGGELGDHIRCGCGNRLVYGRLGWRVNEAEPRRGAGERT